MTERPLPGYSTPVSKPGLVRRLARSLLSPHYRSPKAKAVPLKAAALTVDLSIRDCKEWTTKDLYVVFATSQQDDSEKRINVAETLGHHVRMTEKKKKKNTERHYLPQRFNQNTEEFRAKTVLPHFSCAATAAGFSLISKGIKKSKHGIGDKMTMICSRGKPHTESRGDIEDRTTKRVATTGRPITGEDCRCLFQFHIFWDDKRKRWWMPFKQEGNSKHVGHLKMSKATVAARVVDVPKDDLQVIEDCAKAWVPTTCQDNLITLRCGLTISKGKMDYFNKCQRELQGDSRITIFGSGKKVTAASTPADKLLAKYDADNSANYMALYAEFDDDRLTIRKRKKYLGNISTEDVAEGSLVDSTTSAVLDAKKIRSGATAVRKAQDKKKGRKGKGRKGKSSKKKRKAKSNPLNEDRTEAAKRIRTSLTCHQPAPKDGDEPSQPAPKDGDEPRKETRKETILLAFVWTTDDCRSRFDMFPELVCIDTVNKTNKEERPLAVFAAFDAFRKTFSFMWGFLPSESRWVFTWLMTQALPALQNKDTLERVSLVITDQDGQLVHAMAPAVGKGSRMKNAVHRLCAWHKLNRNLTNHRDFLGLIAGLENDQDARAEWNGFVTWLWALTRKPEDKHGANLMFTLLDLYLQEDGKKHKGEIGDKLKTKLRTWIESKFVDLEDKLFAYNFLKVRGFDVITSSPVESENSATKCHAYATCPRNSIDSCHGIIVQRQDQKHKHVRSKISNCLQRKPSAKTDRESSALDLTKHSSDKLWEEHGKIADYLCYPISSTKCLVKWKPSFEYRFDLDNSKSTWAVSSQLRKHYMVPRLQYTRTVELKRDRETNEMHATCTCGFFERQGLTCRHIFAALGTEPTRWDAQVRWWLIFQYLFNGDEVDPDVRKKTYELHAASRRMEGPMVQMDKIPTHPRSKEEPLAWYQETLAHPKVAPTGYWATESGRKLVERAYHELRAYTSGGIRPFELVDLEDELVLGQEESEAESDDGGGKVGAVRDERNPGDNEESLAPTFEGDASPTAGVSPFAHLSHVTDDMVKEIDSDILEMQVEACLKGNKFAEFSSLTDQILKCANSRERVRKCLLVFHSLHQELITDLSLEENANRRGTGNGGEMLSLPNNMSGKQTSNNRPKRRHEK